jgi:predicted dithiol-disulfide oxidoreductase (DUF899 family)
LSVLFVLGLQLDGAIVDLNQRDVTMLCASRAPLEQLDAFKRRMSWSFQWVSSLRTDFDYDFQVSLPATWSTRV